MSINNIIIQDDFESDHDFYIRKEITLKLFNNEMYPINNMTAVVCGRLMTNKMKYNVIYEDEIEKILSLFSQLLEK